MGKQIVLLEQGKLVAHGGGPAVEAGVGGDRLGGHRLAAVQVVLHHLAQDQLLSGGEHDRDSRVCACRVSCASPLSRTWPLARPCDDRAARLWSGAMSCSSDLQLGLGVADDLVAGLLGDRVHDHVTVEPRARCR